jgi:hypothetical protein
VRDARGELEPGAKMRDKSVRGDSVGMMRGERGEREGAAEVELYRGDFALGSTHHGGRIDHSADD